MLQINQIQTTSQVAENYGVSKDTIRDHYERHSDELIENIHYFYEINPRFKTKVIRWTLEGVYMLGFFIKSERAKDYRKKVAKFLRLCKEQNEAKFKEAREHNLRLVDEISNLRAVQILKGKRHRRELANKQGQITKLKNKLAFFDAPEFKPFSSSHPSYLELFRLYIEALGKCNALNIRIDGLIIENEKLKQSVKSFDKGERITIALAKIQKELDRVYSGIGAVMAYANEGDRYFLEHNEITKG